MIKNLPPNYTKIHHISPNITSWSQIIYYYILLTFVLGISFFLAILIVPEGLNSPTNVPTPSIFTTWWFLLPILSSGVLIHHLLSLAAYRFLGRRAVHFARQKYHGLARRSPPTWLSSVWMPNDAFQKKQYLFIVIFPFGLTLLILYAALFITRFVHPIFEIEFLVAIIFEVLM